MVAYCLFSDMDEILLTSSSSRQAPREVKVTMELLFVPRPLGVQCTFSNLSKERPLSQGKSYQID